MNAWSPSTTRQVTSPLMAPLKDQLPFTGVEPWASMVTLLVGPPSNTT
jgi:hypothetical protein